MQPILTMFLLRPYVFGFLVAFLFLAVRLWGWARTALWLGLGYGIAWASEALSIRTGFPYGWYFYKYENLTRDILVAGVPLWDSLSYTFLIFAGYTVVKYRWPRLSPAATAIAGGAATMLLDIMIDPVSNLGDRWFLGSIYYYPTGGAHFGVPISNYIGWFFVSWLVISVFQRLSKQSPSDGDANKWTDSVTGPVQSALYPAFYLAIGIFNTAIAFWIDAPAIGIANTVILIAAGLILYAKPRAVLIAVLALFLYTPTTDAAPKLSATVNIPQMMSEYSPLDTCNVVAQPVHENEPNDAYEARCPAHDGYTVTIFGGDVRTWLVLKKGKTTINLQGVGEGDVHFPMISGKKLEWRYQMTGSQKDLMALIFRVTGQDPKALSDKTKTYLYVVRPLTHGFCMLGKTQSNEAARHIADTVKTCQPFNN